MDFHRYETGYETKRRLKEGPLHLSVWDWHQKIADDFGWKSGDPMNTKLILERDWLICGKAILFDLSGRRTFLAFA